MTVPREMQAMVLERAGAPLRAASLQVPEPGPGEILIKVAACGVCRTDLHIFDGELSQPKLPLVLGHEIVGHVAALGAGVAGSPSAIAWACRGWAGPTARASIAAGAGKSLRPPALHRLSDRGGYADTRSPTRAIAFKLPDAYSDWKPRRCSAPG